MSEVCYRPKKARAEYQRIIAQHKDDPDPKMQDQVGAARISLGYALARTDGMGAARAQFLAAAHGYKGTHAMSEDFGGVPDQALYQAAVCLMADGKKQQAKAEFLRFLKDEKLSPLCHAAYRRLVMLNGNKSTAELDAMLQAATTAQENHVRFETSVCGPKCIEHLLGVREFIRAFGPPASASDLRTETPDSGIRLPGTGDQTNPEPISDRPTARPTYKSIAVLCGTTDKGTTIEGMRKGLEALGHPTYAWMLNAHDLERAPLPAILAIGDHFVVLEKLFLGKATVYDPRYDQTSDMRIPKDDGFSVAAILFRQPRMDF